MRPVAEEFDVSQEFAGMPTGGVVGNINASPDTPEYWVGRYGDYQHDGHAGMDFRTPVGTPVHAMASGTVLWADWGYNLPGSGPVRKWLFYATFPGKLLVIQHWWGIGAYAHLSEFRVRAGDTVAEGQVVALSGNTGGVDPHLHVEALVDLSYRTGGGLIYGRTNPANYFGNIAPQGEVKEEDDMAEVPQGEWDAIKEQVGSLVDNVATKKDLEALEKRIPGGLWSYRNPNIGGGDAFQILRDALAGTNQLTEAMTSVVEVAAREAAGGASEDQIRDAVNKVLAEGSFTWAGTEAGK